MRRSIASVVVAALALLGAWALGAGPAGAVAGFGAPVVVSGLNDSEPGIDVAADGTIYINAIPGIAVPGPSPSHLWRSTDGGISWTLTPPSLRAIAPGGGDFDIAVEPGTGTLYSSDLWLGSATVAVSTDKGTSWIANPMSTPVQDRQWVAAAGGGRVYHVTHQIPAGLVVARSTDGGLTYPLQVVAATPVDQTGCICAPGNLIAQGGTSDRVGAIYATSTGGIKFARSTNSGLTFTNHVVSPASSADVLAAFPIVANAGSDRLAATWLEIVGNPKRSRVMVATSTNWGQTWSSPVALVTSGTPLFPWLDARGSKIGVSLFHTTAVGIPDTVPASALWHVKYLESANFGSSWSSLVTVDPTAVKSGPICTDGINCEVDRELGDFQSMALNASGKAFVTWARSINGERDTEIRFARQP